MLKIIYGTDPQVNEAIRRWVSAHLELPVAYGKEFHSIGVMSVPENADEAEIIAGIIYHDYK